MDAERRGQRRSMAALSRLSLLLWAHLASRDDEMVGNIERRGGPPMRRCVHEIHEAARSSRGRSAAPKVRVCTHLACGFWPAGRQLAWLKGGLQWRVEVDFSTEVSMLWGHVASCRLEADHGGHEYRSPPAIVVIVCAELMLHGSWICSGEGVLKKKREERTGRGLRRGPV